MIKKLALALVCVSSTALSSYAAAPAFDNAGDPIYADGWQNTDNGGSGFTAWTFTTSGAGGQYVGGTAVGNPAFGVFSGGAAAGDASSVNRFFAGGSLLSGETFSLTIGASGVFTGSETSGPGVVGLNLLAAGSPVFTFKFTGGGTVWQLNDGGSDFGTNIPFASNTPIDFNFTYNGGNSYDVVISQGATTYTGPGFTAGSNISSIDGFRVFSNAQGAGQNVGFNDISVVPEPSSLSLLAGPAILGAWFFVRRRRA